MVAHRRADRCRHWNPYGVHRLRLNLAKPRSRHVVLATFSLIIIYASILGALNLIHHAIMWRRIINASIFGGASVWYFYFKPNVVAYFRELKKRALPIIVSRRV